MMVGASSSGPTAIPASAEGLAITVDLDASEASFTAQQVRVEGGLTHPRISEIEITLEHGGVTAPVVARVDGPGEKLVFDTRAADFFGAPAFGPWTLRVVDPHQRAGTLERWRLEVRGAVLGD
jgi:subtilisin-like proprotein convertase family protein